MKWRRKDILLLVQVLGFLLSVLPVGLQASQEPHAAPLSGINRAWLDRLEGTSSWGRNPFNFPRGGADSDQIQRVSEDGLLLSAILYHPEGGVAIINHRVLREGDYVGQRKVISILKDRVILEDLGGILELKLRQIGVK